MKPDLIKHNKDQLAYLHKLHLAIDIDFESEHASKSVCLAFKEKTVELLQGQIVLLEDRTRANGKIYFLQERLKTKKGGY